MKKMRPIPMGIERASSTSARAMAYALVQYRIEVLEEAVQSMECFTRTWMENQSGEVAKKLPPMQRQLIAVVRKLKKY